MPSTPVCCLYSVSRETWQGWSVGDYVASLIRRETTLWGVLVDTRWPPNLLPMAICPSLDELPKIATHGSRSNFTGQFEFTD